MDTTFADIVKVVWSMALPNLLPAVPAAYAPGMAVDHGSPAAPAEFKANPVVPAPRCPAMGSFQTAFATDAVPVTVVIFALRVASAEATPPILTTFTPSCAEEVLTLAPTIFRTSALTVTAVTAV